MLAYYANNFKGGILEFEVNTENPEHFVNNSSLHLSWGNVNYGPFRDKEFFINQERTLSEMLAFQKHEHWKHEEEVRFVGDFRFADYLSLPKAHRLSKELERRTVNGDRVIGVFAKDDGSDLIWTSRRWKSLIDENEDFHPLVEINKSALTGIYLGCRFQEAITKEDLEKFPNLGGKIVVLDINSNTYSFDERMFEQ